MLEAELLDSQSKIKAADPSGMLELAAGIPEMLKEAQKLCSSVRLPKLENIGRIFIAGMGGSGISAEIIRNIYRTILSASVEPVRNYTLPRWAQEGDLLLALSYSGETEETISALKEAERRRMNIIAITSGGKLKNIADEKNYPLFLLPLGYPPRAALPHLLVPLLYCLEKLGFIPATGESLKETIELLERLRTAYGSMTRARQNPAKQWAKKLLGRIPVIFASDDVTGSAGARLKTQFNENSKITALFNVFPELNHNELVNLADLKRENNNFSLIVLRDDFDQERIKKRIEITKSLLSGRFGGSLEISSQGKSHLARLFSLIYFGDLVSVYLAILRGVDPTPVEVISRLKKEMGR